MAANKKLRSGIWFKGGAILCAAVVAIQFVRPALQNPPVTADLQASDQVKQIFQRSCYNCHSNETTLSWFDQPAPAYWLVVKDVKAARNHVNFSEFSMLPAAKQKAILFEAVNQIQLGAMPLPSYRRLHPEASVTPQDLATLKAYLAPWAPAPNQAVNVAATVPVSAHTSVDLAAVKPELNAFPFDPDFENWKLISTTDRGDNNTFRFILGNDVAVKAAQSGNISPWPDGARFAKIAWQQSLGPDGLLHPGNFVQVELMMKDSQRYKDTDGWGWGRWLGLDLDPYGKDARFVNECTGCHQPVRGNDYVYTLPITAAELPDAEVVNNNAAGLPTSLPYQPLGWSAITMYVDPKSRTMATLFGNDAAMRAIHPRDGTAASAEVVTYPAGAVLALVTWAQRDDPHWFGARIPNAPQSVEFVGVTDARKTGDYRRFVGAGLIEDHPPANFASERTRFVLDLAPARLP